MLTLLQQKINRTRENSLYRQRFSRQTPAGAEVIIDNKKYISFSSNDYLGLANHPDVCTAFKKGVDKYGVGSGASALLGGYTHEHQLLEEELADFLGYEKCLLFPSGFMANLGVIKALVNPTHTVLIDKLSHASLIDAVLSTRAPFFRYQHNDIADLTKKIVHAKASNLFFVTEGVFSMEGDLAPLSEIIALTRGETLLVDDAHGIGVIGEKGQGIVSGKQHNIPILTGTFGKAFGTSGAFVASNELVIDALVQYARSYIYTTALAPAVCAATRASLNIIRTQSCHREKLNSLIAYFRKQAEDRQLPLLNSNTAIQPLFVGDDAKTMQIFSELKAQGFWVAAVRPPTVPPGQSRLRISLSALHTTEQIDKLLDQLILLWKKHNE